MEASSACCVRRGIVQLLLDFNAVSSPSGRTLTAAGLSPDAIAFNLTGQFTPNFIALGVPMTIVTASVDAFAGARAAGSPFQRFSDKLKCLM